MIPVEAVEAAARAYYEATRSEPLDDGEGPPLGFMPWESIGPEFRHATYIYPMQLALDAAAPILLSHEREQTRLAHLDAMLNRETKRDDLAAEYRRGYRDGLIDRKQVTAEPREWEPGDPLE